MRGGVSGAELELLTATPMFAALREKGFQIEFCSHARAILEGDFPAAAAELERVLLTATLPVEEIVAGGGGEAQGTQRLRRGLAREGWIKQTFVIRKTINDREREAVSHEVDHVKSFAVQGETHALALEIEWNNKDPFFDRDLENFKRLHGDGAISVGIIVTKGKSLHEGMRDLILRFARQRDIGSFADLERWGYTPTPRQRQQIERSCANTRRPATFAQAFTRVFVSDKFGEATTHWRKLEDRIRRGVGNPCPLVLVGLPAAIVTFGEDEKVVAALIEESVLATDG